MNRLKEIKDKFDAYEYYDGYGLSPEDIEYLIKQAETLNRIDTTWVAIETNGTSEDADNFYTIVQDILTEHEKE